MADRVEAAAVAGRLLEVFEQAKDLGMTVTTEDGFRVELRNMSNGALLATVDHNVVRGGFYAEVEDG